MNAATNVQVTSAELYIHIPLFYPHKHKNAGQISLPGAFAVRFDGPMLPHPAARVKRNLPFGANFCALPAPFAGFSTVFGQDDEEKLYFLLLQCVLFPYAGLCILFY